MLSRHRSDTCRVLAILLVMALAGCSSGARDRADPSPSVASNVGQAAVDPAGAATDRSTRRSQEPTTSVAIATGGPRETNYQIGRDLERWVAPDAGIELEVMSTSGSADNLHRLTNDPRVDLAIVQYDVMQAMVDEAKHGDKVASRLVGPVRIVVPLYAEEIYFVVRSDASMKSVDDIRGKRINLGPRGSGSALTAAALYRRMFKTPLPTSEARYLSDEQALTALTVDKTLDVVVVVAGQPARLFADMKSEARNYIRLLPIGGDTPPMREALKVYLPTKIRARSYSAWLQQDVPALSVVSFLVTSDRQSNALLPRLADFTRSMCRNIGVLKAEGHPKWREVQLGQQLGFGWKYATASEGEFKRCTTS